MFLVGCRILVQHAMRMLYCSVYLQIGRFVLEYLRMTGQMCVTAETVL